MVRFSIGFDPRSGGIYDVLWEGKCQLAPDGFIQLAEQPCLLFDELALSALPLAA